MIVNSPHNPSGRIYSPDVLRELATLLTDASARIGHPIWIISDEPYNRIVFDGRSYSSPAEHYPHTIITYSYGKTLLAPGKRIGYLTVPPTTPEREELREAIFLEQVATGYAFPNALLQHALGDLEQLSIDIGAHAGAQGSARAGAATRWATRRRMPEGTFYTMARSPIADDVAFAEILARHRVLVLPGTIVEVPGWFRISLTASSTRWSRWGSRASRRRPRRPGRSRERPALRARPPGSGPPSQRPGPRPRRRPRRRTAPARSRPGSAPRRAARSAV